VKMDVTLVGDDDLIRFLDDVGQRATHAERPLEQIADDFERIVAGAFGGTPSLVRFGDLEASLTGMAQGTVREVTGTEMIRGTSVWYSRFHSGDLLDPFDAADVAARWMQGLTDWLERGGVGGGLGV